MIRRNALLAEIPPRFEAHYLNGDSLGSIARRFDCSPTTVWKHLKRRGVKLRPSTKAPP